MSIIGRIIGGLICTLFFVAGILMVFDPEDAHYKAGAVYKETTTKNGYVVKERIVTSKQLNNEKKRDERLTGIVFIVFSGPIGLSFIRGQR